MNKLLSFVFLCFIYTSAIAQGGGENSPFSRFGIGDLVDEEFMHSRHMGGLGASYQDVYNINLANPASYASLKSTAFDVGLFTRYSQLSDTDGNNSTQWSGNIEYISLAFPLSNPLNDLLEREERDFNLAMSFTLIPHSVVGYNISTQDTLIDGNGIIRNFTGNGGTNKFYWGNAFKYKDFSFGVNLGYLFGNLEYQRNILFTDAVLPFNTEFTNDYSVAGFIYNIGAQYTLYLNQTEETKKSGISGNRITFGVFGRSNTGFNTTANVLEQGIQSTNGVPLDVDTLNFVIGEEGSGTLPGTFGIGATYHKGARWAWGVNYTWSPWSNYNNDANPEELNNTQRISVGGHIRPNYKSYNSFLKRAFYRYGAYYNTDPREIDNKALTSYGVTFGLGLPFVYQRKVSHANIGVNLGRRGQGTPISESFARFTLSFTFNDDEWFIKRKYE
jgi:hypothetical protein